MRSIILCIVLVLLSIAACFALVMLGYTKAGLAAVFFPVLVCPFLMRRSPDTPRRPSRRRRQNGKGLY